MTQFRLRQWGAAGWQLITIQDEDEDAESFTASWLRGMLSDLDLHVQEWDEEEEEWEDLDA